MRRFLSGIAVLALLLAGAAARASDLPVETIKDADKAQQAGDIAWMLVSTALVMLMVPGLALFYGGMVRRKNVLGTMMHSMVALSIIGSAMAAVRLQPGIRRIQSRLVRLVARVPRPRLRQTCTTQCFRAPGCRSLSTACIKACSPSSRRR